MNDPPFSVVVSRNELEFGERLAISSKGSPGLALWRMKPFSLVALSVQFMVTSALLFTVVVSVVGMGGGVTWKSTLNVMVVPALLMS